MPWPRCGAARAADAVAKADGRRRGGRSACCCCRARWRASSCATTPRTCCARPACSPSIPRACATARSGGCRGRSPTASAQPRRRLVRSIHRHGGRIAAVVIFHPLQYPMARGVLAYEEAQSSGTGAGTATSTPTTPARSCASASPSCTSRPPQRSALTFVCSTELQRLEHEAGREATLVPLAADSFPAPDPAAPSSRSRSGTSAGAPTGRCCARSPSACPSSCCCSSAPGTTTSRPTTPTTRPAARRRTSSGSARAATRRRRGDPLRRRRDRPVQGRAVQRRRPALPDPQVRAARAAHGHAAAGRREDLGAGGDDRRRAEAFVAALRASAGARTPTRTRRCATWALAQTAETQNAPLWERLRALGVDTRA